MGTFSTDYVLAPSAVRIASGTGTPILTPGKNLMYNVLCEFTDKQTDATDKMDVYVDVLVGATWINVIHFTQALGNGTDSQIEYVLLCPSGGVTAVTSVVADLASGAVRSDVIGTQMRARWVFTDGGGGGVATFTFSVSVHAL